MSRTAWYLGCSDDEVADTAILIGDPARIDRIAALMDNPVMLPVNRGLRTVTGEFNGQRITAAAFGMGAPIATIVLHELFDLGVRTFLRIGTAMAIHPVTLGDFVVADAALRAEGTSGTYAPVGYPAVADFDLNTALRQTLSTLPRKFYAGVFGTYDGFYTEMFALSDGQRQPIEALRADATRLRLIGTDMETSALLVAGRILGARVSTLCVATVDAMTQEKLEPAPLAAAERDLFEVALTTLSRSFAGRATLASGSRS